MRGEWGERLRCHEGGSFIFCLVVRQVGRCRYRLVLVENVWLDSRRTASLRITRGVVIPKRLSWLYVRISYRGLLDKDGEQSVCKRGYLENLDRIYQIHIEDKTIRIKSQYQGRGGGFSTKVKKKYGRVALNYSIP